MTTFKRKDIAFNAENTTLRGWLYTPEKISGKSPAIIMAHGWGAIKEMYLDKYAECFASAGYVVVVYDNRNFGDSDGEIRQEINPWQQINDYRHAITFAQTLDFVDPNKIGVWGTSYSGGHVLVVAALDKRVKCVVSQVPTVNGWKTMLRRKHPGEWASHRNALNEDRLNRFKGGEPKMIPIVNDPNAQTAASHVGKEAWEFYTGANRPAEESWRFTKWTNAITLRSVEMYSEYEPESFIEKIAPTPLLMLVAEDDTVAVTDEALAAFNRAREIKKVEILPGNHFSPYVEVFNMSSEKALAWFKQYL